MKLFSVGGKETGRPNLLRDLGADVDAEFDTLGGGRAIVIGQAFGTFPAKASSTCSFRRHRLVDKITGIPIVLEPLPRLIPKDLGFIYHQSQYTQLAGGLAPLSPYNAMRVRGNLGSLDSHWACTVTALVLEIIFADGAFQPESERNVTTTLNLSRADWKINNHRCLSSVP
ncbi:hypothetical protein F1880_001723 [Penicillium rolfsii]|nr:hypothetical protein F1880_001723 [Penicillium rolfsii]